jgi:hypothetical protein
MRTNRLVWVVILLFEVFILRCQNAFDRDGETRLTSVIGNL